jgi:hypothetical protein
VRTLLALPVCALLAWGGTEPKPSATDYPAHAALGACSMGAEFFARTIPIPNGGYSSGGYLVVEVALFPAKGERLEVRASEFRLVLNGAQREILPQTPGIVAASLKYPEEERRRGLDAMAGVGPVVVGRRQDRTARFPGDPRATPPPPRPSVPEPDWKKRSEPAMSESEAVARYALDEGVVATAVSGLLYYAWSDRLRDLKRIDLAWMSPCGRLIAKLR